MVLALLGDSTITNCLPATAVGEIPMPRSSRTNRPLPPERGDLPDERPDLARVAVAALPPFEEPSAENGAASVLVRALVDLLRVVLEDLAMGVFGAKTGWVSKRRTHNRSARLSG